MISNGIDALTAARAERDRLQAALEDALAAHEKTSVCLKALAIAEKTDISCQLATARAKWLHSGCEGPEPIVEDFVAAATPDVLKARHAVVLASGELEKLHVEHRAIVAQLSAAKQAVVDAAAKQTAEGLSALADRAKKLRRELAGIETELAAGYHFFVEESDHDFARSNRRNPALTQPQLAALSGLPEHQAEIRNVSPPSPAMLAKHREEFARLLEGK